MSNLDVSVSSFWQLARHWKSGGKAKLELTCEDGSLHIQLSAVLGDPDQPHFPHPPPHHPPHPPPYHPIPKKKSLPPSCAVRSGGGRRHWIKLLKLPQPETSLLKNTKVNFLLMCQLRICLM